MRRSSVRRPHFIGAIFALVLAGLPAMSVPPPLPVEHRQLYAAPDGRPDAPGTREQPLSLDVALSDDGPTRPGDTVWLRGGTYKGVFTSTLKGTSEAPITVRQAPGERATIDSSPFAEPALTVLGSWGIYWGFELTNSDPQRRSEESGPWPTDLRRGHGVFARGPQNSFINLVIHDLASGLDIWTESEQSRVYGNLVYYNGWEGSERAHGHGIYTQNKVGTREIADNIVFGQFSHGIHAYGSNTAYLDDITLRGNAVFNNGMIASTGAEREILLGGGRRAARPVIEDNVTYGPAQSNVGYIGGCSDAVISRNYFVGVSPLILVRCTPAMRGNTFVGDVGEIAREFPDNDYRKAEAADGTIQRLRVNRYEPDRAHVAIYNWTKQDSVDVDASEFLRPGNHYEVIDAQNYFGGPVASGTYEAGKTLSIPMKGLKIAAPVGKVPQPPHHSGPEFGVFIIRVLAPAAVR